MKTTKKFIPVLFSVLLSSFVANAQMPAVSLENSKGETVSTASLVDGTPMIISFWSTTCKPCIRELDAINELLPDWLDEADFKVVAVSTDDARFTTKARSLAEGHGWTDFIVLYDKNQAFMRAMNVTLTPQVYVMDGNGKIVYSHTGYTPGSELELIEKIKVWPRVLTIQKVTLPGVSRPIPYCTDPMKNQERLLLKTR